MKNKAQEPTRILLTGSTGQVGWELHRSLIPLGEIIAPNRKQFDLANPESLRSKIQEWKPDIIINPAAYTAVDQAEDEAELAFTINAVAPKVLAEEASRLKIPLIHYSTDYVFDGKKETPYAEQDAPNPLNVYGESKLAGENAIQKTTEQHLILRTSWVYSHRRNNFLTTMLKLFQEKEEIKVVDDQVGAPTSARILAETTASLFNNKNNQNNIMLKGTYHLTAAGNITWYDFAKEIQIALDLNEKINIIPISSKEYTTKAIRPSMSLLNNDKITTETSIIQPDWKLIMALEVDSV